MTYRSDSMYKSHDVIYQPVFCKIDFATSEIVHRESKIRLGFMETTKISIYAVDINISRIVSKKLAFQTQLYSKTYKNADKPREYESGNCVKILARKS